MANRSSGGQSGRQQRQRRQSESVDAEQPAEGGAQFASQAHPRGAGIYPQSLEQAVMPGDYVEVLSINEVRRVDRFLPLPTVLLFGDGITVAAGGLDENNEATNLRLPDNWFGQYRILTPGEAFPTDIEATFDLGGENAQLYATNETQAHMDRQTGTEVGRDGAGNRVTDDVYSSLLEFYTWEDEGLFFTFNHTNSGGAQQTIQDVRVSGFVYRVTPDEVTPPPSVTPEPLPTQPILPKA